MGVPASASDGACAQTPARAVGGPTLQNCWPNARSTITYATAEYGDSDRRTDIREQQ